MLAGFVEEMPGRTAFHHDPQLDPKFTLACHRAEFFPERLKVSATILVIQLLMVWVCADQWQSRTAWDEANLCESASARFPARQGNWPCVRMAQGGSAYSL